MKNNEIIFLFRNSDDFITIQSLKDYNSIKVVNLSSIGNQALTIIPNVTLVDEDELYEKVKAQFFLDHLNLLDTIHSNASAFKTDFFQSSLWWFSEFQHKDNFYEKGIYDLIIDRFLKSLSSKLQTPIYLDHIKDASPSLFSLSLRILASRTKLLLKLLMIKISHSKMKTKSPNAFYSFFPNNWKNDKGLMIEKFSAQFDYLNDRDYINSISARSAKPKTAVVESYLGFFDIFSSFFKLHYFFKFLVFLPELKSLCHDDNRYFHYMMRLGFKTTLLNDFYYGTQLAGLHNYAAENDVKNLVSTGEMGLEAYCVSVTANNLKIKSTWFQHAIPVIDKLYYHSTSREILQKKPLPDIFYVWSDYAYDYFKNISRIPEDSLLIAKSIKQLKIPAPSSVRGTKIIFCPSADSKEIMIFINFINDLIERKIVPSSDVLLKLHPTTKNFLNIDTLRLTFEHSDQVGSNTFYTEQATCIIAGGTMLGPELSPLGLPIIQYMPKYYFNWSALTAETASTFNSIETLIYWINHLNKVKKIESKKFFSELA